jgi:DNA-binding transcriptional ArsR family regulator
MKGRSDMAFFQLPGPLAATRSLGQQYRQQLEQLLATVPADETIIISFEAIEAMTGSFTDEFLGKLLVAKAAGLTGRAPIILTCLTEETAEEVDLCLERRKIVAAWNNECVLSLLGGDPTLKQTFAAGAQRGEFRASDLATDLKTTQQNVNNRLKRLTDAGVLLRDRQDPAAGGREFRYRIPTVPVPHRRCQNPARQPDHSR